MVAFLIDNNYYSFRALSRAGKSVLQLDPNEYYGGNEACFPLKHLTQRLNETNNNDDEKEEINNEKCLYYFLIYYLFFEIVLELSLFICKFFLKNSILLICILFFFFNINIR